MDWENERYVRVYTRDTTAMRVMVWDELCLFWELLRKVDMAGILDLEGYGAEGLAVTLRCPVEVAERSLTTWTDRGWVELHGETLLIPSHIAAQEAKSSDAQRKRTSREKRRAAARLGGVTPRDAEVTPCDGSVTERDEKSHAVTRGHTASLQPSLAEPSLANPTKKGASPVAGPTPSMVKEVWRHFIECRSRITKANPPQLNDTRRQHIKARLRSYGTNRVMDAVTAMLDPLSWYVREGRITPEMVFRSDEQLEKHEGNAGARSEAEHLRRKGDEEGYDGPLVPGWEKFKAEMEADRGREQD